MTARTRKAAEDKTGEDDKPAAPSSPGKTQVDTPETDSTPAQRSAPRPDRDGDGKPDSGTTYLNVSTSVLRYDKAGHQVAPGDWTPAINLDAIGKAARQHGHLLPHSQVD